MPNNKLCAQCSKPSFCKGLCNNHYKYLWAKKNKEKRKKSLKKYHASKKAKVTYKKYRQSLKGKRTKNANWWRYNTRKLKAMPKWVNVKQINSIYNNCPKGYHVDHIIPLKGINVSGLHVPWNLQYLTPRQNRIKSNKVLI